MVDEGSKGQNLILGLETAIEESNSKNVFDFIKLVYWRIKVLRLDLLPSSYALAPRKTCKVGISSLYIIYCTLNSPFSCL